MAELHTLRRFQVAIAALVSAACALTLSGCATVTADDRARIDAGEPIVTIALGCPPRAPLPGPVGTLSTHGALTVVSWNIHRNVDAGWEIDLARFAGASEMVILQEAGLTSALREILARAGRRWVHADAWELNDVFSGVLTASTVLPQAACVLRAQEPLLGLPKTAIIAWYRLDGRSDTLAVANVHSINFTLDLGAYQRQLEAVAAVLAQHHGPVILAGDFNTWSPMREFALVDVAESIGLAQVPPRRGERSRFLGLPADYLFTRGFVVDDAWVDGVKSSDHAPIRAILRYSPP